MREDEPAPHIGGRAASHPVDLANLPIKGVEGQSGAVLGVPRINCTNCIMLPKVVLWNNTLGIHIKSVLFGGINMEIKLRGEMTIADIRQALFEQLHDLETNYSIKFSRGATLYIHPTNGFGDDVIPRVAGGRPLTKLYSIGPYRSAADERKL
jgi:hypothetical protein